MIIIYLGILLIYIAAMVYTKNKKAESELPGTLFRSQYMKIFLRMGSCLYKTAAAKLKKSKRRKKCFAENMIQGNYIEKEMKLLYPTALSEKLKTSYLIEKVSIILLLIFIGNTLAVMAEINSIIYTNLKEGNFIVRNTYGMGSKEVDLKAAIDKGNIKKNVTVTVREQQYTANEIEKVFQSITEEIDKLILGENKSLNEVRNDLELVGSIKGKPVQIEWQSDNYSLINSMGKLNKEEIPEEGVMVDLTAKLKYYETEADYCLTARLLPEILTEQEEIIAQLMKNTKLRDEETRSENKLALPVEVADKNIVWKEQMDRSGGYLLLLGIIGGVFVSIGKDRSLLKEVENRNRQLLFDYPELLSKLLLLLGAGMTIKGAWNKIASDYELRKEKTRKKKYVYEEMLITCREMQGGIAEIYAYEKFGRRCQVQCYIKLGALLGQNLKKGSVGLIKILESESGEAFEIRKNTAKRLGEEAGTKLLLPMVMMLAVVMIIIIVPAFLSF